MPLRTRTSENRCMRVHDQRNEFRVLGFQLITNSFILTEGKGEGRIYFNVDLLKMN